MANVNTPYSFRFVKMDGGGPSPELQTLKTSSGAVTRGDILYVDVTTGRLKKCASATLSLVPYGVAEETLAAVAATTARDIVVMPIVANAVFRIQCATGTVLTMTSLGRRMKMASYSTGLMTMSTAPLAATVTYVALLRLIGLYENPGNAWGLSLCQVLVKFIRNAYSGSNALA